MIVVCWLVGPLIITSCTEPLSTKARNIPEYYYFIIAKCHFSSIKLLYVHIVMGWWDWLNFTSKLRNSANINIEYYASPIQSCNSPRPRSGHEQDWSRSQRSDNPFYHKSNQLISLYLGVLRPSHLMPVSGSITRLFTFPLKPLTCLE